MNEKLPLKTALWRILLMTLVVSGSAFLGFMYYGHLKKGKQQQSEYNIIAIVQTSPDKEVLPTIYFAEKLQLSIDHPTNIFRFDSHTAEKKLLMAPFIQSASVKKIIPGTIYIDYSLRKPFAYLLDYQNAAIDHKGVPFPFNPYYTPKILPEVRLGIEESSFAWGKPIQDIKCKLALYLVDLISENCCTENSSLVRVDVSQALADSYGQRQIVVIMDERIESWSKRSMRCILRLSVDNYRQELANYLALRPRLKGENGDVVIDLRIAELAYLEE